MNQKKISREESPAMTLFYGITNLFGIGASSLMSRSMGQKDMETVKRASATGLYLGLIGAMLLSAITILFNTPALTQYCKETTLG